MPQLILVFLGLAAMATIATELEAWAAGPITAAGYLVLSLLLAGIGLFILKKVTMKPRRLLESLKKEDAISAKNLMKSSKT